MDPMHTRGLARWGIGAAVLIVVGCKTHPNSSPSSTLNAPAPLAPAAQAPSAAKAPPGETVSAPLPEALARKTAEYARSLESTSAQSPAQSASASLAQASPSRRPKFLDPPANQTEGANGTATLPPAQVETASAPKPHAGAALAVVSPTDAAHVASVARSAKANSLNDVPAIVPESSDFPGSSSSAAPDGLEQRLAKRVQDNPRDIASQLDYQLYELLNDESSPQLASISSLPNEDRELVAALVDGVNNFRTTVRQDNNMLLSKKIRPILDMADRIRSQGELNVPTVVLCKRVDGFGKYEPIDPPRFPAGRDNPAIVYCEIQNFESRLNDHRQWETKLTQEVTLFTETGMLAWKDKPRPVSDECRNRRHDFFLYDLVKLPANLSIGRYLLKVTIVDRTANRVAESTLPVEIVAQ
jgi:hypothetical protein